MSESNPSLVQNNMFYFEVYNEIESLLSYCSKNNVKDIIPNRIFVIYNSIGSELDLFLKKISDNLVFNAFEIDFSDDDLFGKDDDDLSEKKVIKKLKDFLESKNDTNLDKEEITISQPESDEKTIENADETVLLEEDSKKNSSEVGKQNNPPEKKKYPNIKLILCEKLHGDSKDIFKKIELVVDGFIEISESDNFNKKNEPVPILILVTDYFAQLSREIISKTDLSFIIPYPQKIQRLEILELIFNNLKIHTVDLSKLSNLTQDWNVKDLKRLVKAGFIKWKMKNFVELEKMYLEENKKANENSEAGDKEKKTSVNTDIKDPSEIGKKLPDEPKDLSSKLKLKYIVPFTIEIFEEIIGTGQIKPLKSYPSKESLDFKSSNQINYLPTIEKRMRSTVSSRENRQINTGNIDSIQKESQNDSKDITILRGVNITDFNSFTTTQFYQFGAVNKFDELIAILEKISTGKMLDELDRNILADYPFILKDDPKKAMVRLTNAKNRIDRIKKSIS
jgi:hypothetical protein